MIPVEKPAALPKANALDPRRDSVAESELLNPAPVAQGERVMQHMISIVCSGCHQSIGPRHIHDEHLQETNLDHENASLKAEAARLRASRDEADRQADKWQAEAERLKKEAFEAFGGNYLWRGQTLKQAVEALAAERDGLRKMVAELEAKLVGLRPPAWAYQLLDAQPSWPHGMFGGLVKVVAHYERGKQTISGGVVARAIAAAKELPPPTREYEEEQPSSDAEHRLRLILDFVELVGKR